MLLHAHIFDAHAAVCYARAAELDPVDPRWPYLIGIEKTIHDPRNALPFFRTAYRAAFRPEHKSAARLRLAEVLVVHNAYDEAKGLFEEELAADPDSLRARYGLAQVAAARDDPAAVIRFLEPVAGHPTLRQKAAAVLGPAYLRVGNSEAAARAAAEIGRPPEDRPAPDPFIDEYMERAVGRQADMSRVRSLEARSAFREALPLLERLDRAYPNDLEVRLTLAIFLARTGEFDRAEQLARGAVRERPGEAAAHFYLGTVLATRAFHGASAGADVATYEEALGEFRRACELKPGYAVAHGSAGLTLRALGRRAEAVEEFRAVVRYSPAMPDARLELGRELLETGDARGAVEPLEAAVRMAPDNARARELLQKARAAAP
jgi:tetratricopeptide (TPR) repeat protein